MKNHKLIPTILLVAVFIIPLVLISVKTLDKLDLFDVILLLVYPLLVSYAISFFSTNEIKTNFNKKLDKMMQLVLSKSIVYHGTKYTVPNSNHWWNTLAIEAREKFYLLGQTNKSWIDKNEEQSKEIGDAIIRIVRNGGEVRIISENTERNLLKTKNFLNDFVLQRIDSQFRDKSIAAKVKANVHYRISNPSFYNAVVSDKRIVIISKLNTEEFRPESVILELTLNTHPQLYNNYLADIERFYSTCEQVNWINETE